MVCPRLIGLGVVYGLTLEGLVGESLLVGVEDGGEKRKNEIDEKNLSRK